MSLQAIILLVSFGVYIAVNNYFIRTDEEFKKQTHERKMFSDPLGIQRIKQQPFKMTVLMAILLGPILGYYFYASSLAG